jgi:hypothetical protein
MKTPPSIPTLVFLVSGGFTLCALTTAAVMFIEREQLEIGAPILVISIMAALFLLKIFVNRNKEDLEKVVRCRDRSALRRIIGGAKTQNIKEEK